MVSWINICKPKAEGGLGIKNLSEWNIASGGKLMWDILLNKKSLWNDWIRNKYMANKSIWDYKIQPYYSSAWKGILKARSVLRGHISYIISDGQHINLCIDPWINGYSINQMYGDHIR